MARAGEGRYFKRSGDSFYRMEHYDIEDMFGRRKKPVLKLGTRASIGSYGESPGLRLFDLLIYLSMVNEGRGSAKAPFLSLNVVEPYSVNSWGLDGNRNFGLPTLKSSRANTSRVYGASSDFVIHPDTSLDVTVVSARVIEPEDGGREIPELKIHYKLAAEDAATVNDTLTLSPEDLAEEIGSA